MPRKLDKEEAIKSIKSFLKLRLRKRGHDTKTFSEKWLNEKAEEIYLKAEAVGDFVHVLEPKKESGDE